MPNGYGGDDVNECGKPLLTPEEAPVCVEGGAVRVEFNGNAVPETVPVDGAGEPAPVEPPVGLGKAVELVCGYGAEL